MGMGEDSEMIVEVNGKKFEYDNRSGWENKVGEHLNKNYIDVIAYIDNPGIFFQIFREGKGYNLQKKALDYSLEYGLDEMDQSKIVELVDLYFNDDNKFNTYFSWSQEQRVALTKEEKKEYKKLTPGQEELINTGSILMFVGAFLLYFKFNLQDSPYRFGLSGALFLSSYGFIKCWKWEKVNNRRLGYKPHFFQSTNYPLAVKWLYFAVIAIILGLVIVIIPYIWGE